MLNRLKQYIYYFLGLFIGLSSRLKKSVLSLKSPQPRMLHFDDYKSNLSYDQEVLQSLIDFSGQSDFLQNKKILEIGPGPDLLLGLLSLEAGASSYHAIDYFPVLSAPISFYENLKKDLKRPPALTAVNQIITSLVKKLPIEYPMISYQVLGIEDITRKKSLNADSKTSENFDKYDFIFSKDVLEHIDDLDAAFKAMHGCLKANGIMIHKIDFQTHTSFIQEKDRLNFLRYSDYIYNKFVKFKGGPNRLRLPELISLAETAGFKINKIKIDKKMAETELVNVRGYLGENYNNLADNYLFPLSAWVMFERI